MSRSPSNAVSFFLILAVFFAATLLIAGWTIADGPIVDDNPLLLLTQIFTRTGPTAPFLPDANTYWRPIAKLTFVPWSDLFGFAVWPHRLLTLLLHALACTLLFKLGERLLNRQAAILSAILFLLHPLHAGNLHWLSARFDLTATVLLLGGLYLIVDGIQAKKQIHFYLATVLFTAAYFAKEIAFVAPLLVVIIAWPIAGGTVREKARRLWLPLLAPTLTLAIVLVLRRLVMGTLGGPGTLSHPVAGVLLGNVLLHIPRALLFPLNREAISPGLAAPALVLLLLVFAVLLISLWRWRQHYHVWLGILFAGIASLPIASFLYLARSLEAGYMLYLPSVGFVLWIGALAFPSKAEKPWRPTKYTSALLGALYLPLLQFNLLAYHHASTTAEHIVTKAHPHIVEAEADIFLLENLPDRVDGLHLFYDHVDQLFWSQPWSTEKTLLCVGPNFWRTEGKQIDWRNPNNIISLIWRDGDYELSDSAQLSWLLRSHSPGDSFTATFTGEIPPSAQAAGLSVTWNRGPITLPLTTPDSNFTANTIILRFSLRTFDPRAAKEAAIDWVDKNGVSYRALFAVNDDGKTHTYNLLLAVDPRWARIDRPQALSLHLPFVAGEIQFRE